MATNNNETQDVASIPETRDALQMAAEDPQVPKIYANGFLVGIGAGDIYCLLQANNQPIALLNMSYTVAKSLYVELGILFRAFEESTGQAIMTTDFVLQSLEQFSRETGE